MGILSEFLLSFAPSQSGYQFMWILAAMALISLLLAVDRWLNLNSQTNIDMPKFFERLSRQIKDGKVSDAMALCRSGNTLAIPRILGAGLQRSIDVPEMAIPAMEEETLYVIPKLEQRLNLIATSGNLATLLGLMGTIYGLIIAFAAVAQPDVSPVEKSSMLAIGISAAMNTTLLGLMIAVPCVLIYSMFRAKIDDVISDIDRYTIALVQVLNPDHEVNKAFRMSSLRVKEEVQTEPNMVPFMNLMVVLIPLLLSSSEFVKIGMIELKLPDAAEGGGGGNDAAALAKVDLGIVITSRGFNLFHYFKKDSVAVGSTEIPQVNGEYDYATLNKKVAEIKRLALYEIVKQANAEISPDMDIWKLGYLYSRADFSTVKLFEDHESVKIVAEDKINYQTVVSVMDAARGVMTPSGLVTLFPNVSLAGGIIQ